MKSLHTRLSTFATLLAFAFPGTALLAQNAPVTLTLGSTDKSKPVEKAKPISPLFSGISMETEIIRPAADGSYYFSEKSTKLAAVLKQIGVKHVRIGGNTVDDKTKTPGLEDIDHLFAFAKMAGVKITYSVRLKEGDPKESAKIAKHIYDNYADLVTGITIGNETDQYYHEWSEYIEAAKAHAKAMKEAAPAAALNGPGIHLDPSWLTQFADAFKGEMKIEYIGGHAYFGGNAYGEAKPVKERDPAPLREEMLSKGWHDKYDLFYRGFGPALAKQNLPFRIDETNTFYIGGAPGASNSMAAAVWALDYMYWWADRGAMGVNFHTGTSLPFVKGRLPGDAPRKPCLYAVLWALPDGTYPTQAVGYGMKAFDLGSKGKLSKVEVASADEVNVKAYAVEADDGSLFLTIINKEIGTTGRQIVFKQPEGTKFGSVESIALGVKDNNAGATEGFTVGGAGIGTDGSWDGKWSKLAVEGDAINVNVPATSAVVLRLSK